MSAIIDLENKYGAKNYAPLPVVLKRGEGVYVWDVDDRRYLDMMSAYSAVSHGHCHPQLVAAMIEQSKQLNVVSRAYYSDKLAAFLERACLLTNQDKALVMNTGAEAVETALKAVRRWAYQVKKVEKNKAEIITCEGNFHGRTIAIIAMSSEADYQHDFGPFPKGFKTIPYNDTAALESAITKNTAAFLVEPIQGEGGIIVPDKGYLKRCAEICKEHNVLLICDEIQTGLGRTGRLLASEHDAVKPDGLLLGKALGGGLLPVSMFLSSAELMAVFNPGSHGSTFGGNPLAAVVGLTALNLLVEENYAHNSQELGNYFMSQLRQINSPLIKEIRGKGLFIAIEVDKDKISARDICLKLLKRGILSKETHHTVIRLAPPLIIKREQLDEAIDIIKAVFFSLNNNEL